MAFDDLDIFAPLDDDVNDDYYTPRHMKHEQRKPIMKTLLRITTQLLVLVAVGYATLWLTWQFALLINIVTTQVWQ